MKGQTTIDDLADAENQAIRGGATLVRACRFRAECTLLKTWIYALISQIKRRK